MRMFIGLFLAAVVAAILLSLCFRATPTGNPLAVATQQETGPPTRVEPSAIVAQPEVETRPTLSPRRAQLSAKTLRERIAAGDTNAFNLSAEQIQAFLSRNQTNAESLLAAFNVSGDLELLREAARRFPRDAFVLASVLGNDALPDQRRELLEQFKEVSPENPLANYLSAREDLKNQQPALALKEMAEAASKTGFT